MWWVCGGACVGVSFNPDRTFELAKITTRARTRTYVCTRVCLHLNLVPSGWIHTIYTWPCFLEPETRKLGRVRRTVFGFVFVFVKEVQEGGRATQGCNRAELIQRDTHQCHECPLRPAAPPTHLPLLVTPTHLH